MLEAMRKSLRSPISVAFLLLIVLSFVVWGTGDIFQGGTGDAVVIVGPEKITVDEYASTWRREVNSRIRASNGKFSEIEAKERGMDDQLLERMISETALDAKLNELGVSVSRRMMLEYAKGYEAFKDPLTGEFTDDQYLLALTQAQLTPKMFESEAKADLGRRQVMSVIVDGVSAPISYTRNLMAFQQEMRQVESVFLPSSSLPSPSEPTREQLQKMIDQNPAQFAIPERRAATLVLISARDLELDIQPTEEELRATFDFRKAEFTKLETRSWVQVPTQDQVTADLVSKRLQAGEEAADIMLDMKLDGTPIVLSDADVSNSPDDQIAEAVFAAVTGDTGATEGRFAWAAWKLQSITAGEEQTFEEVQDQLREDFTREEARNRLFEIMGDFEGSRGDGMTMDEAAEAQNLVAISLPPVDRSGLDETSEAVEFFTKSPEMLETLFLLDELVESDIEETEQGDFYALSVDEIVSARNPELDEVFEQVKSAWTLQQTSNALRALADSAKAAFDAGEAASDIAAKHPQARVEIAILNRYQPEPTIPPSLARQLFAMEPGQSTYVFSGATEEIIVSRLQTIIPAPLASDASLLLSRAQLDQELSRDIESQFINGLRSSYTIRRDNRLKDLALGDG
ncbi:MAG: hypothetical protein COA47_07780 [Robiginitomaculum sp.]|nr:MAG: hypothetical protein COA47_07780 [Robiginitomaculum sp.]